MGFFPKIDPSSCLVFFSWLSFDLDSFSWFLLEHFCRLISITFLWLGSRILLLPWIVDSCFVLWFLLEFVIAGLNLTNVFLDSCYFPQQVFQFVNWPEIFRCLTNHLGHIFLGRLIQWLSSFTLYAFDCSFSIFLYLPKISNASFPSFIKSNIPWSSTISSPLLFAVVVGYIIEIHERSNT